MWDDVSSLPPLRRGVNWVGEPVQVAGSRQYTVCPTQQLGHCLRITVDELAPRTF
jgi:hypothetical protein